MPYGTSLRVSQNAFPCRSITPPTLAHAIEHAATSHTTRTIQYFQVNCLLFGITTCFRYATRPSQ